MNKVLYLDYFSTTPVDPIVQQEMIDVLTSDFGNPSSTHFYGWRSHNLLKKARQQVADLIEAPAKNIVFNSGATEGNNTIVNSVVKAFEPEDCHLITSEIEHKCILKSYKYYEKRGYKVSYLPTNSSGEIIIDKLLECITPKTRLISIMAANNETGVLQDIEGACRIAKKHEILIHVDAAQWIGKIPFSINQIDVDFLTLSAHKFYGPKGIGALYARSPAFLRKHPLLHGGDQESNMRAGTVNLPSVVGLASASSLAMDRMLSEKVKFSTMKKNFIKALKQNIPGIDINGSVENSLPNVVNFFIPKTPGRDLISLVQDKLAISTGSACTSLSQENSHVLTAMGFNPEHCQNSLRLSFGRFTEENDLKNAVQILKDAHLEISQFEKSSYQ